MGFDGNFSPKREVKLKLERAPHHRHKLGIDYSQRLWLICIHICREWYLCESEWLKTTRIEISRGFASFLFLEARTPANKTLRAWYKQHSFHCV